MGFQKLPAWMSQMRLKPFSIVYWNSFHKAMCGKVPRAGCSITEQVTPQVWVQNALDQAKRLWAKLFSTNLPTVHQLRPLAANIAEGLLQKPHGLCKIVWNRSFFSERMVSHGQKGNGLARLVLPLQERNMRSTASLPTERYSPTVGCQTTFSGADGLAHLLRACDRGSSKSERNGKFAEVEWYSKVK